MTRGAKQFPYGTFTTQLPAHFAPPESWPEYSEIATPPGLCSAEAVGVEPRGIRWSLWPLCFEQYTSDKEPSLTESRKGTLARNRMLIWRRIGRTDIPPGWILSGRHPWRVDGFFELSATENYITRWHTDARRKAQKWLRSFANNTHKIEVISLTEFVAAYKKSSVAKKFGLRLLGILEHKAILPETAPYMTLWGIRNIHTGEIVAGTATIDSPTHNMSVRECPFMLKEARSIYGATALMDHWFGESQKKGIATLVFTYFWQPGDPKDWKGFSEFKSHFGLQYVAYQPELIRFVRGKLW